MRDCWKALQNLSYGVYVVSAIRGEDESREMNAMSLRMMTQVSTRPPRLALAVAKSRRTHEFLCERGEFAVSILAEGQELLGGHFGLRSGRDVNKLTGVEYFTAQTGAPILEACCAWVECRVEAAHDMGNCTLFIAEVFNGGVTKKTPRNRPLAYRHSDYFG